MLPSGHVGMIIWDEHTWMAPKCHKYVCKTQYSL